jgi:16S rRNA (adenine1518-N6/adenine1519-N6)-dimethyltransferase
MIQYYCETQQLFTVPPNAFNPPPKVNSAVVRLIPRDKAALERINITVFAEIVKYAFQQRRKTIRNSLKNIINDDMFTAANIDPQARAENLSVEDYIKLANLRK